MALLRLIRFPNLLIVALMQGLLFARIILPPLQAQELSPALNSFHFSLLALVTVIITAGGYIINDIADFRIDMVNRPERVVVHKHIPVETAYWLYFCLNLSGFVLSLYLAFYVGNLPLVNLFPAAVLGLFFYSVYLKRVALLGNLLISAYCALAAGIVWFAERNAIGELASLQPEAAGRLNVFFLTYMGFAFLLTFYREIVKDIEDVKGDLQQNCRTIPILWGVPAAKSIAMFAGLLLLGLIAYMGSLVPGSFSGLAGIFIFVIVALPLAVSLVLLYRAGAVEDYRQLSGLAKFIMAGGIMFLLFI
jgi:4-hydroxybenzoate polyprenyltransferase